MSATASVRRRTWLVWRYCCMWCNISASPCTCVTVLEHSVLATKRPYLQQNISGEHEKTLGWRLEVSHQGGWGRKTVNVLPRPGALSTWIYPPCAWAME